jgi:hypothetical protein
MTFISHVVARSEAAGKIVLNAGQNLLYHARRLARVPAEVGRV